MQAHFNTTLIFERPTYQPDITMTANICQRKNLASAIMTTYSLVPRPLIKNKFPKKLAWVQGLDHLYNFYQSCLLVMINAYMINIDI